VQQEEKREIKIGVLIPETGTFSTAGVGMKNAANLALKHIEEFKFAGEYVIKLEFADCGSTPEKAKAAFIQLASQNVVAIVGAYSSQQAIACADAAKETGVPYIATVASTILLEKKVEEGNKYVFRNSYNSTYWGVLAAEFLNIAKPEHYYFVGFDPLKTFNQEMLRVIEERVSISKIGELYYKSPAISPDDVKIVAQKAAEKVGDRDVLILGDPGGTSVTFLKEYRGAGGKGIVYSVGGALALPATLEKLEADYTAFQAAALKETKKTDLTEKYFSDYKEAYGEEANNYASILTYDSILMLAQALEKGGEENLIETLEKEEFKGAAGVYRFNEKHTALWGSEKLKGVIGEYVSGVVVLYPPEFATSGVIWQSD
jgi:branched-chain amino acid transport system substrate-binding protein